ncbi:hypothetical protein [Streptomyces goshikiensis]|uniref:hypothetical protein n=1 Tax=Streptomyces goshikiensis TaxID=1942 RepID=UPI003667C544
MNGMKIGSVALEEDHGRLGGTAPDIPGGTEGELSAMVHEETEDHLGGMRSVRLGMRKQDAYGRPAEESPVQWCHWHMGPSQTAQPIQFGARSCGPPILMYACASCREQHELTVRRSRT